MVQSADDRPIREIIPIRQSDRPFGCRAVANPADKIEALPVNRGGPSTVSPKLNLCPSPAVAKAAHVGSASFGALTKHDCEVQTHEIPVVAALLGTLRET